MQKYRFLSEKLTIFMKKNHPIVNWVNNEGDCISIQIFNYQLFPVFCSSLM